MVYRHFGHFSLSKSHISKHLMLWFIRHGLHMEIPDPYFKTSHVMVYPSHWNAGSPRYAYFKTSHVMVYHRSCFAAMTHIHISKHLMLWFIQRFSRFYFNHFCVFPCTSAYFHFLPGVHSFLLTYI